MNETDVTGYKQAVKLSQKYTSLRAKRLQHLEQYVDGTQYEGLPDWFSDKAPLWERAPCIVYPIVKAAIDSNSDLLLGDGRFPAFEFDGLVDDPETAEKTLEHIIRQSRFKAAAREVFAAGQGCGSACAVFGFRGNRLFIDTLLARWCVPTFDLDGQVTQLDVQYPYLEIEELEDGTKRWACMLYRRVINDQLDIAFKPAKAKDDGKPVSFTVDTERTITHGLGFCPVIWFSHVKGCVAVNNFDGKAIHEHLTDEIRAHDFALSQRHRAALFVGDPQWVEIGVEPGYNPTATGRAANIPASLNGRPGEAVTGGYVDSQMNGGGGASKTRKKSPGTVWQYPGKAIETKVEVHCLPGDALTAIDTHAKDIRSKICEALGVVFIDPESLPNESRLSGKALESFKARQLDKVNYYRADFGDHFIVKAMAMLIRIAIQQKVPIKGLEVLAKATKDKSWSWISPPVELVWGEYFHPNGEEENYLIMSSAAALTAGFMTKRATVELRKNILGIRDVDAFMAELEKENEENQKKEVDMAVAMKPPPPPGGAKPAPKGPSK